MTTTTPTVLLTGFPGFLGAALTERLLARDRSVTCLVERRYHDRARERAAALRRRTGMAADRLTVVTGDITAPALGLDSPGAVADRTDALYHLAAVYDLGVARDRAERVNVTGTDRVLDFAERAAVDRLHYVSTCYVSGRYDGVYGPTDTGHGPFNNHYEASKHRAESIVRERRPSATIYRPAITCGDSTTGATQKFDGLYYLLGLLERQRRAGIAAVPVQPPAHRVEFNVVPRDFVVDALAELSARPDTVGETYHLSNPNPPTVDRLIEQCARAVGVDPIRVPVHARLTRRVLERVPGVAVRLGVEPAALDYLSLPTRYVCPNTITALTGTDVACPPLSAYVDRLVAYMREQ